MSIVPLQLRMAQQRGLRLAPRGWLVTPCKPCPKPGDQGRMHHREGERPVVETHALHNGHLTRLMLRSWSRCQYAEQSLFVLAFQRAGTCRACGQSCAHCKIALPGGEMLAGTPPPMACCMSCLDPDAGMCGSTHVTLVVSCGDGSLTACLPCCCVFHRLCLSCGDHFNVAHLRKRFAGVRRLARLAG